MKRTLQDIFPVTERRVLQSSAPEVNERNRRQIEENVGRVDGRLWESHAAAISSAATPGTPRHSTGTSPWLWAGGLAVVIAIALAFLERVHPKRLDATP